MRGSKGSTFVRKGTSDSWQTEAWGFYHSCGEFRFGCDWVGAMLSKALLHATKETTAGIEVVKDESIMTIMGSLCRNADERAEMLRLAGIHMSVAGEFFIVSYPDPDPFGPGGDVWMVAASTKAKKNQDGVWTVHEKILDKTNNIDPEEVLVIRIWRPDPIDPEQATSPARAVLRTLRELAGLSDHVAAQIDSRLAGAGILLLPSDMQFPAAPEVEGETREANTAEDLMAVLRAAMEASMLNRADASALVPIVITAPADAIAAVKHMTFWTELDAHAIELRNEAIRRLALGMDMPPEVLQGSSDSNHWSAWQADESAIKSHTEPLLKIITTALAKGYLRPLLADEGGVSDEDLHAYSIGADTSEMRLRPNRSKEAVEMYDRGELSGAAMLREVGFDDADAMDEEERKTWFIRKVAAGSTTPELVQAALEALGVQLSVAAPAAAPAGTGTEGRPAPTTKDHPVRDIPDPQVSQTRKDARSAGDVPSADVARKASLMLGAEQAVFRALERTGNRMRNKVGGKAAGMPPAGEMYQSFTVNPGDVQHYLEDAFGANVVALASHAEVDPGALVDALDSYCRLLLMSGAAHDFTKMSNFLSSVFHQNGVLV
jgi:hypothetical protein